MSDLASDLLDIITQVANRQQLPAVRGFELPPQTQNEHSRKNNFAALVLEDGSVGLTYVALDDALKDLRENHFIDSIQLTDPLELAELYRLDAGWQRALGLSAINAISQHVLGNQNILSPMHDTLPVLLSNNGQLSAEDHIGMVGYFGRLVEPLMAMGARLTVIELDENLVRTDGTLEVTLDTSKLSSCNKVVVTGTTLLNHTLDNILSHCTDAREILMLGPTASCLPDPLFDRGVTLIGGLHVADDRGFVDRWRAAESWRECGFRYSIRSAGYPGY